MSPQRREKQNPGLPIVLRGRGLRVRVQEFNFTGSPEAIRYRLSCGDPFVTYSVESLPIHADRFRAYSTGTQHYYGPDRAKALYVARVVTGAEKARRQP